MQVSRPDRLVFDALLHLGRLSIEATRVVGELAILMAQVLRSLFADRQRRKTVVDQLYRIGVQSLPVVVLTGLSIGLVLAVQAYTTLKRLAGENATGSMVAYILITQLAPVITGLMLSGRVGSAIAAEIGAMKVTEQVDALRVMGTDPVAYLVAPRFLACVLLMPCLTAIGALVGLYGAAWLSLGLWGLNPGAFWGHIEQVVQTWDVLTGLSKTLFFGGIIALVACRRGLHTTGGATGVGAACTQGVVSASLLILASNFVLTVVYQKLYGVFYGL